MGGQGGQVFLFQVGVEQLPRRSVRVHGVVNDFRRGVFQLLPANNVCWIGVEFYRFRGRFALSVFRRSFKFRICSAVDVGVVVVEFRRARVVLSIFHAW